MLIKIFFKDSKGNIQTRQFIFSDCVKIIKVQTLEELPPKIIQEIK